MGYSRKHKAILLTAALLFGVAAGTLVDSSQVRLDVSKRVSALATKTTIQQAFVYLSSLFSSRYAYLAQYEAAVDAAIEASMADIETLVDSILLTFKISGRNIRAGTLGPSRLVAAALGAQHILRRTINGADLPDAMIERGRFPTNCVSYEDIADGTLTGRVLAPNAVSEAEIASGVVDYGHLSPGVAEMFDLHTGSYPGEVSFMAGTPEWMEATGWVRMDGTVYIPSGALLPATPAKAERITKANIGNPYLPLVKRIERSCDTSSPLIQEYRFFQTTVPTESFPMHIRNNLVQLGITLVPGSSYSAYRIPNWTGLFLYGAAYPQKVATAVPSWKVDHMHKVISAGACGYLATGVINWEYHAQFMDSSGNPFTSSSPQYTSTSGTNSTLATDTFVPKNLPLAIYLYTGVFYESN